jgi:hypothetical protein
VAGGDDALWKHDEEGSEDGMTIRVTISNGEQEGARKLRVTTVAYEKGKQGERVLQQEFIGPRNSATFYVHMLQDLRVEEVLSE